MSGIICQLPMHCKLGVICIFVCWANYVGYVLSSAGWHDIKTFHIRGWHMCRDIFECMPSATCRYAPQGVATHALSKLDGKAALWHVVFDMVYHLQTHSALMQHHHPLNAMSVIICRSQMGSGLRLWWIYLSVAYLCALYAVFIESPSYNFWHPRMMRA